MSHRTTAAQIRQEVRYRFGPHPHGGFILGFRTGKHTTNAETGAKDFVEVQTVGETHTVLQVFLKYGPDGEKVIRHIERYSKPGRREMRGRLKVSRRANASSRRASGSRATWRCSRFSGTLARRATSR